MSKNGYLVIYNGILDDLKTGSLKIGDALNTEMEFAERFNVSRTTVRRALTALEKDGKVSCKPGVGRFVADLSNPESKNKIKFNIGIESANGNFLGLTSANSLDNESSTTSKGWPGEALKESLKISEHYHINLLLKTAEQLCNDDSLDGAIFTLVANNDYESINELSKRKPVVLLNRINTLPNINYVAVDYTDTVYKIIHRLITNGAKNIVFAGGANSNMDYAPFMREKGYRMAYIKNNLPINDDLIITQNQIWEYNKLLKTLENYSPDIIFMSSSAMIFPVVSTLQQLRGKLKKECYLICFDDIGGFNFQDNLTISGINMPFSKISYKAIQYIVDRLNGITNEPLKEVISPIYTINKCPFII